MHQKLKEQRIAIFAQFIYLWMERGFDESTETITEVQAEGLTALFAKRPVQLGVLANASAQAELIDLVGSYGTNWCFGDAVSAFVALIAEYYPSVSNPLRLDCMEFSRAMRLNWEEVRRRHWDARAEDEEAGRTFEEGQCHS